MRVLRYTLGSAGETNAASAGLHNLRPLVLLFLLIPVAALGQKLGWKQWGQNSRHDGSISWLGQNPDSILTTVTIDPWVPTKIDDSGGDLLAHYPSPLIDGNDVFLISEGGRYIPCSSGILPCGAEAWDWLTWSVRKYSWNRVNGQLEGQWSFLTDWRPLPGVGWEPVFHPVVAGDYVYTPGASGSVWRVNRSDGSGAVRISPFVTPDPNTFVSGPLTVDDFGNVYYNVIQLWPTDSLATDIVNSWLVKVSGTDRTAVSVSYADLTPGAPAGKDLCNTTFTASQRPWPPSPAAAPSKAPCGTQRPGVNISPAIGTDGTIYSVTVAHLNSRYAYIVAVNPDLTSRWIASLRGRLEDGCGFTIPYSNDGGCRPGTAQGVDFQTNDLPAGRVIDQSSSTPVVAPDGSVFYGAYTFYNAERGHLFHFDANGKFLNSFDFGWDTTPAIWAHDGTYSVILKDNHYGAGPFYITQLDSNLNVEWQFASTNTQSCVRNDDGTLSCTDSNPNGFEWCINAAAVDAYGTVYANSEDGNLYVINQGGTLQGRLFLNWALGAAYTPLAIGPDGLIYTQNAGRVFVVGATN